MTSTERAPIADASVMTVTGPLPAEGLGVTQCHEHLFMNAALAPIVSGFDGLLDDEGAALDELAAFAEAGGGTIVEVTTPDLGRQPELLRLAAQRSGVNIVMGCGYYRSPYHPPSLDSTSTAALAESIVAEIDDGVDDTGVRPGIIGEIGSDNTWISATEERVFRACALAQRRRGLPLMTHTPPGAAATHVDLLADAGAVMTKVAIGHADGKLDRSLHRRVLDAGCYLSFDLIGTMHYPDHHRARCLAELIADGHADRILLSMDICRRTRWAAWGGTGLGYLLREFLPLLRDRGVAQAAIDRLLIHNPARYLAVEA